MVTKHLTHKVSELNIKSIVLDKFTFLYSIHKRVDCGVGSLAVNFPMLTKLWVGTFQHGLNMHDRILCMNLKLTHIYIECIIENAS